jgi:glycosyltransferase involved in cell wall biosynthesis
MISVIIAAHNEGAVIGRCLDALLNKFAADLDVTVVANGCTDNTAAVARARAGVRVIELSAAGKPAALNAGDRAATGFPRVYLDADIPLTAADLRELAAALEQPGVLAVTARRVLDTRGRPLLVRAHAAINGRLPVYRAALFGRGVAMLSKEGRARFDRFPDVVADDLFLDSLFTRDERVEVHAVTAMVATPRRTSDLVHRLARVPAGNSSPRAAGPVRTGAPSRTRPTGDRSSWLRDVVLPRPWLLPAAVAYVGLTIAAARAARGGEVGRGQGTSTRTVTSANR